MLPSAFVKYFSQTTQPTAEEKVLAEAVLKAVKLEFSSKKYVLGLCIDFCLLAQDLQVHEPAIASEDLKRPDGWLFERFERRTHSGTKELNSLTIHAAGETFGIRKYEELVKEYFHGQGYMSYPSAYVYNTGQWSKFTKYLNDIFRLGEAGRRILVESLVDYAQGELPKSHTRVVPRRSNLTITKLLREYPMSATGENAGLTFQAICFSVVKLLYPHLSVSAASVRTGSRRQGRLGDIDGYEGDGLAVTCEVKDLDLTPSNIDKQAGQFSGDTKDLGVIGIIFCRTCDIECRKKYPEILFADHNFMRSISRLWDQGMYDTFRSGVLYYLSQIECNEAARKRFEDYTASLSA